MFPDHFQTSNQLLQQQVQNSQLVSALPAYPSWLSHNGGTEQISADPLLQQQVHHTILASPISPHPLLLSQNGGIPQSSDLFFQHQSQNSIPASGFSSYPSIWLSLKGSEQSSDQLLQQQVQNPVQAPTFCPYPSICLSQNGGNEFQIPSSSWVSWINRFSADQETGFRRPSSISTWIADINEFTANKQRGVTEVHKSSTNAPANTVFPNHFQDANQFIEQYQNLQAASASTVFSYPAVSQVNELPVDLQSDVQASLSSWDPEINQLSVNYQQSSRTEVPSSFSSWVSQLNELPLNLESVAAEFQASLSSWDSQLINGLSAHQKSDGTEAQIPTELLNFQQRSEVLRPSLNSSHFNWSDLKLRQEEVGNEVKKTYIYHPCKASDEEEYNFTAVDMYKTARRKRRPAIDQEFKSVIKRVKVSSSFEFCPVINKNVKLLLKKVLKVSDVGILGRIIIPKKVAEETFPFLRNQEPIQFVITNIHSGQKWTMKYRYRVYYTCKTYLLEQTADFVKENGMELGDSLSFYKDESKEFYYSLKKAEDIQNGLQVKDCEEDNDHSTLNPSPQFIPSSSTSGLLTTIESSSSSSMRVDFDDQCMDDFDESYFFGF